MIGNAVTVKLPGSRVSHSFDVLRTHDGKLRFKSDRTVGIYNPRNGSCFYSTRGNSDEALRNQARKVNLTPEIVAALDGVAKLSDKARQKLLAK